MPIEVWLARGRKVEVGGRQLYLMPLPLKKLFSIVGWLEENSKDVVKETAEEIAKAKEIPNPLILVTRVLGRVNVSSVALDIFSYPKDPETREPINKNIDIEFFDEYLDIPTAHKLFNAFVELNDIEELIKNLQSLPVVRKIMEAAQLTFGIPYLNSLQQNMASAQSKPEGLHSLKSTDSQMRSTIAEQVLGETTKTEEATGTKKQQVM